ncbi:hypothetical protein ACFVVC_04240 [Pseudarthrobacter sp. NPDC058196]
MTDLVGFAAKAPCADIPARALVVRPRSSTSPGTSWQHAAFRTMIS